MSYPRPSDVRVWRWTAPLRAAVPCMVAIGCAAASGSTGSCPPSPFRSSPPLVIAHGGGEGLGPMNTIEAMHLSMAAGADMLDADLWMTTDGVIVARHDRDVSLTTNGTGSIDRMTWNEVEQLEVDGAEGGDGVPALEAILTEFPEVPISLEIKQVTPPMGPQLCDVLERTGSKGRAYVSSNEDEALYAARDTCDGMRITTTYRDLDDRRAAEDRGEWWCAAAPIGQPPYRAGRFTAERVASAHAHGEAIFTWTVDDPETLRQLAEVGVDAVYTGRPDIARRVFDEVASGERGPG